MNHLPKKIIRIDDGAEFLLNEATQMYSLWMSGMEHHLHNEYTYDRLMNDSRLKKGAFKVADGTEDLKAMRKAWMDRMNQISDDNRGCGDDDE